MADTRPPTDLVKRAEGTGAAPDDVRSVLTELLGHDARLGIATALGILSRPPRIKPSTGLLIDPSDQARRGWSQRVAAAAALIGSAAVQTCFDELADELADSRELARDVLAEAPPFSGLSDEQVSLLLRLGGPAG